MTVYEFIKELLNSCDSPEAKVVFKIGDNIEIASDDIVEIKQKDFCSAKELQIRF
jgi:hypothetical protein